MVKKISVEKLRLGMYICGTDRKWIDLPFFRSKFLLHAEKEIAALQHYCKQVLIDTEKGCDEEAEVKLANTTAELADTFEFATDFDVVELSSGELALINNHSASGMHIMTDASKQLLAHTKFIPDEGFESQDLEIARVLANHDPLCELLMAVYARTQETQAKK